MESNRHSTQSIIHPYKYNIDFKNQYQCYYDKQKRKTIG